MMNASNVFSEAVEKEALVDEATETLPYEDLRLFTEVFHQIRENYVNEVTDHDLFEYAISIL